MATLGIRRRCSKCGQENPPLLRVCQGCRAPLVTATNGAIDPAPAAHDAAVRSALPAAASIQLGPPPARSGPTEVMGDDQTITVARASADVSKAYVLAEAARPPGAGEAPRQPVRQKSSVAVALGALVLMAMAAAIWLFANEAKPPKAAQEASTPAEASGAGPNVGPRSLTTMSTASVGAPPVEGGVGAAPAQSTTPAPAETGSASAVHGAQRLASPSKKPTAGR